MYLRLPLLAVTLLSACTSANPVRRALSIPPVPADPLQPLSGDGAGPYGSQSPSAGGRAFEAFFYTVAATAAQLNLPDAARNMRHYLGNSGDDLTVTPESMMKGLPIFQDAARALAQNEAAAAFQSITGQTGEMSFASDWETYYATKEQSQNWFYAIGGFSYSTTGVVTKTSSGGGSLKYQVHIFDRYNWDAGKSVTIGRFTFEDTELGNLHLQGLAREYIIRGSSEVNNVATFAPTSVIPPPSTGPR